MSLKFRWEKIAKFNAFKMIIYSLIGTIFSIDLARSASKEEGNIYLHCDISRATETEQEENEWLESKQRTYTKEKQKYLSNNYSNPIEAFAMHFYSDYSPHDDWEIIERSYIIKIEISKWRKRFVFRKVRWEDDSREYCQGAIDFIVHFDVIVFKCSGEENFQSDPSSDQSTVQFPIRPTAYRHEIDRYTRLLKITNDDDRDFLAEGRCYSVDPKF